MKKSSKRVATATLPRPSRRYERLIGELLSNRLIDWTTCRKYLMHNRVMSLCGGRRGRCLAMVIVAKEFCCSYETVRKAIYEIEKVNLKTMNQTIKIKNEAEQTVIDIEGTIGLSEQWQFDNPESRVATYERFRECVAQIADISNANILVNIRSTGGDVNDAILIYEALRSTGAHITTCCYGYTASAATIVAQAASENRRLIAPSSLYLIHKSLCSTEGNAEELQNEVEMLRQTDSRLAEIYATRSGRSIEDIAALMAENGGRGRWLSPAEAIAEGLVDGVVEDRACESDTKSDGSVGVRAMKGIKSLMRAIGIDIDQEPKAEDDINYVPRQKPAITDSTKPLPTAERELAAQSSILFDERQRAVKPTSVKEVEDPSPVDVSHTPRSIAYERDAQVFRNR